MSMRYKGGVISATAPTTTTSTASGVWSSENVFQAIGAVTWPRSPAAPTIGTATDLTTGGSVSVAFTAPSDTGSTAITSYSSLSTPGSLSSSNSASPITATGLTNGTAYTFQVRATNSAGTGPYSGSSNSVTPSAPPYIEEVFQTWLYTGNGSTQTITNGINLSGNGGLVWGKNRDASWNHYLADTAQGAGKFLSSNTTGATTADATSLTSFNTTGFSIGNAGAFINNSSVKYVSWSFRKQAKFFDIVTYTGDGVAGRTVSHNLGSTPGCIIVKNLTTAQDWIVYHTSLGNTQALFLDLTAAAATSSAYWNNTSPTSTNFTVGFSARVNTNGDSYVAYIFAHNAGGFGLTGSNNVISCGSFTTDGSGNATVNLGYEPQWLMWKRSDGASTWRILDSMRGFNAQPSTSSVDLEANTSDAEYAFGLVQAPSATGFSIDTGTASASYIYIAIRRGPMKVPTVGTSVFLPITNSNSTGTTQTTGFRVDAQIEAYRPGTALNSLVVDRLRGISTNSTGGGRYLISSATNAESSASYLTTLSWDNTSFQTPSVFGGSSAVYWSFQRAPGFFDEVCYTGTGSATTITHNLTIVPELMIVRVRNGADDWYVYSNALSLSEFLVLDTTQAKQSGALWNTAPTSSVFGLSSAGNVNASGYNYVAYLFATCAGVSKVGSYTGTAALLTVNCSFTTGARFVLIKRTDSTGDWYTYDSARGISSSTDPYLLLNSTAAETTGTNYVDTDTTGFKVTAAAPAGLNASGGTYIFLAIA